MLTPADFTAGHRVEVAAETLRRGLPLSETDYVNAFDRHIGQVVPPIGRAFAYCRDAGLAVFTTGSGPGFFSPVSLRDIRPSVLSHAEHEYDVTAIGCASLSRAQATSVVQL
jgi:hypothetical protein